MDGVLIGLIAALFGILPWGAMLAAERRDFKKGRIPARSPDFLYMTDFWTNRWAVVTLTLVDVAVALWIFQGDLPPLILGVVALGGTAMGSVSTCFFYIGTTGSKREHGDSAVVRSDADTEWILTFGGKFHLGYFFIQTTIGIMVLLLLFQGVLVIPLILAVIGGGFFALTWVRDLRRGLLSP